MPDSRLSEDVTPCSPVEVHRRLEGTYCHQFQGASSQLIRIFDPEEKGSTFLRNFTQFQTPKGSTL
jgi:hypothetical protein